MISYRPEQILPVSFDYTMANAAGTILVDTTNDVGATAPSSLSRQLAGSAGQDAGAAFFAPMRLLPVL